MLKLNKSMSFYGTSVITDNDVDVNVATMDASIDNEGVMRISKYTMSKDLYEQNKDVVDADMVKFEETVKECFTVMSDIGVEENIDDDVVE